MPNLIDALEKKLTESQLNDFGIENYDEVRAGKFVPPNKQAPVADDNGGYVPPGGPYISFKNFIKKLIGYNQDAAGAVRTPVLNPITHNLDTKYVAGLQKIYDQVNEIDRSLLVDLLAYRQLGYRYVMLPRNNKEYHAALKKAKSLSNPKDTYDPHFLNMTLEKFDLSPIGYDTKLYFSYPGIAVDFILEQYAYKKNGNYMVAPEEGDVVLDLGACWGDTALYFANKVGPTGKVYSFEFIPDNMKLFDLNVSFNPKLAGRIDLIPHPVSNISGREIYFWDNGPGSRVESTPFEGQTGKASTIKIDDLVKQKNIAKVDFIKMDIEGSEPKALEGGIETIRRDRPKLAIAMYHGMDDFVNIPNWILDLDLGYEIFIDHFTIHSEETVCFARVKKQA